MPTTPVLLLAAITLGPAPGGQFEIPASITTSAGVVGLASSGVATLRENETVQDPVFRTYRIEHSEGRSADRVFFLPNGFHIVRLPINGSGSAASVTVLVKQPEQSWEAAVSSNSPIERSATGSLVRFAVANGPWEAAFLAAGSAPVILEPFSVQEDTTLPAVRLAPAGRVKARLRASRSGDPLSPWKAHLRPLGSGQVDARMVRFLSEHSLTGLGAQLDDQCVPSGSFELTVEAAPLASRRVVFGFLPGGETADLGDVFLSNSGSLRVELSFPKGLPESDLILGVAFPGPAGARARAVPIGERRVRPASQVTIDFGSIDPGLVRVSVRADPPLGLWAEEEIPIYAEQRADVSLTFAPVVVSGGVFRGGNVCSGAKVLLYQAPGQRTEALADDAGQYSLRVWSPGKYGFRVTPSGGDLPVNEELIVAPDSTGLQHDVNLPAGSFRGRVSDSSGRPIAAATVDFQTIAADDGSVRPGTQSGRASSGADGQFALSGLGPQNIDLDVRAKGFAPRQVKDQVPNGDAIVREIVLERAPGLRGKVVDAGGAPLVGSLVFLGRSAPAPQPEQQTATDEGGEFTFEAAGAGNAVLIVQRCGFALEVRPLSLPSTQEAELVALQPSSAPVTIRFLDEQERPIKVAGVSYEVNGSRLPQSSLGSFLGRCGVSGTSSLFSVDFLPRGVIRAYAMNGALLASFQNGGAPSTWTIRVNRSTPGILP